MRKWCSIHPDRQQVKSHQPSTQSPCSSSLWIICHRPSAPNSPIKRKTWIRLRDRHTTHLLLQQLPMGKTRRLAWVSLRIATSHAMQRWRTGLGWLDRHLPLAMPQPSSKYPPLKLKRIMRLLFCRNKLWARVMDLAQWQSWIFSSNKRALRHQTLQLMKRISITL